MAIVKVDKYGRILIPEELRRRIGLKHGENVELMIKGDELILRKIDTELDDRIRGWFEYLKKNNPKPFVSATEAGDSKWFSREYCLKKLGL